MTKTLATLALIASLSLFPGCSPSGGSNAADTSGGGAPAADETFVATVQPILEANCVKCHGGDSVKAGLTMTSLDALIAGGNSGSPVVPGDPDASLIVQLAEGTHPDFDRMPPKGDYLSDAEIQVLRSWITGL